jgi:decaprenylphospho-beta-D-ribofuranose 2-oxidase
MKVSKKTISGWSKTVSSDSQVFYPKNLSEIKQLIADSKKNNKSIAIRGSGLSYGDNALNSGETILCTLEMNKIINFDSNNGEITVQSGVTIEDIYLHCIKFGWILPSMPGSRYVSIGGALGNNIHGKNCEQSGNIGEHVISFKIVLSSENILVCSREENTDIFYTAISGLGLIGVIIEITMKMKKIPSNFILGQTRRAKSIEDLIDLYESNISISDYSIATIDGITKGASLGKGVLHFGSFTNHGDYSVVNHKINEKRIFHIIPRFLLIKFIRTFIGSKIVEYFFRLHSAGYTNLLPNNKRVFSFSEYHFLMDRIVPDYNLFYENGFYEYQALIPKCDAKVGLRKLIEISHKYGYFSTMTSLKAYRKQNEPFVKSFQLDGYGITLDIKKVPDEVSRQREMFLEMNDLIISYKGKQHLAKTPITVKKQFEAMYPSYKKLKECKLKYDKINLFNNDMCRRIFKEGNYEHNDELQLRF